MRDRELLASKIVAAGVRDPRLLDALGEVPRAGFVPPDLVEQAYLDRPLPIPHGQVTTQPSLSAKMIEALGLTGSERVLEVGTGYGFQTALLARLSGFVWSVERWPDVAETARNNLASHGMSNVEVVAGDAELDAIGGDPADLIAGRVSVIGKKPGSVDTDVPDTHEPLGDAGGSVRAHIRAGQLNSRHRTGLVTGRVQDIHPHLDLG